MKAGFTVLLALSIVVALAVGIAIGHQLSGEPLVRAISQSMGAKLSEIDDTGFAPADAGISGVTIGINQGCHEISFDITDDQAYSIQRAVDNEPASRPLTHDIMRDMLDEFNITILRLRIEKFENEIFYARGFMQQGDKLLDLDMRPSDAIALSFRTGSPLYINQSMLQERGSYIC